MSALSAIGIGVLKVAGLPLKSSIEFCYSGLTVEGIYAVMPFLVYVYGETPFYISLVNLEFLF